MSSGPPAGDNHPPKHRLVHRRVDPQTLKSEPGAPLSAPDEPSPKARYDYKAEALRIADLLSRPLPKPELRRMATQVVRFAEASEFGYGRRSNPRKGKVLRDALHLEEKRIRTTRKGLSQGLRAHAAGELAPKMPGKEDAARRMMEIIERERLEHPDRFLDDAEFAALEERLRPADFASDERSRSHAELAALVSEVKYKLRGEEFDSINAGRKAAKVRKQTAKRVRKHRASKAGKSDSP